MSGGGDPLAETTKGRQMYYHHLTLRRGESTTEKYIGSSADNIDAAARERCKIGASYHPHEIVALTTHGPVADLPKN